jgi:hypothetical protein
MTRLRILTNNGEQLNIPCQAYVNKGPYIKVTVKEDDYEALYDACVALTNDEPRIVATNGGLVGAYLPDFDEDVELTVSDSKY